MRVPPRGRRGLVAGAAVAILVGAQFPVGAPARLAGPGTNAYYVDSGQGDDAAAGTSPETAWRTLARASSAPLPPGAQLLLRRGSGWPGPLRIDAPGTAEAPIRIGSYGSGPRPVVRGGPSCVAVSGTYVIVSGLKVEGCWAGLVLHGRFETVRDVLATHNVAGIQVAAGATDNRVVGNLLVDNNRMSVLTKTPRDDDSGAFGVLLQGDRTVVARNRISGSDAFSYDFGRDGSAVEIFGGRDNVVRDNLAIDNQAFSELGNARSAGNTYAYNVVVSSLPTSTFVVTRGPRSRFGPVLGTRLYHNTVVLTGAQSQGFVCHAGCGPRILTLRNNIIQAAWKAGYADAPLDEDYNLFFGGQTDFSLGAHSLVAPPQFVDPSAGDLHLRASSPAIGRGVADGFAHEVAGRPAPPGARPDLGALPFRRPG